MKMAVRVLSGQVTEWYARYQAFALDLLIYSSRLPPYAPTSRAGTKHPVCADALSASRLI